MSKLEQIVYGEDVLTLKDNFPSMDVIPFPDRVVRDINGRPQANVVDQFPALEFNRNEHGFVKSDISALMQAQSQQMYDLIRSRLQELNETFDDRPIDDIIETIVPKNCQDITEIMSYNNSLGNKLISKQMSQRSSDGSEQIIKFDQNDNVNNSNQEGV